MIETTVATVVFSLPDDWDGDYLVPLVVDVPPGQYGIIFGGTSPPAPPFATQDDYMRINYIDIPGQAESAFLWQDYQDFFVGWGQTSGSKTRHFVEGVLVPEPSTWALSVIGGIAALILALNITGKCHWFPEP